MEKEKTALIIGGGPAGLTAAYELAKRTNIKPVVIEKSDILGGISRTVEYKGNRMDIGGHRFFSKSDRVMDWWLNILPLQKTGDGRLTINYHKQTSVIQGEGNGLDPDTTDKVMLVRNRLSRIYYLRKFFDYPVRLNGKTIRNLGLARIVKIGFSYFFSRVSPIRNEKNLEDFFINRFGKELYKTFFKDYTEKVWGVPCTDIEPEWGAQRIKGLSVSKALAHGFKSVFKKKKELGQKKTETSLIEKFLYPKFGPGHLWEEAAKIIIENGGEIIYGVKADSFQFMGSRIDKVECTDLATGEKVEFCPDYVFSTMPVKELIRGMGCIVPANVSEVAENLVYRDFIAVGLLLKKMNVGMESGAAAGGRVPDNWIYIQEKDVLVGRIQVFNNWSEYLVSDMDTVWLGLEYFCNEGDELWAMDNESLITLAVSELEKIGLASSGDYLDGTVVKMPKTYPAYFGSYKRFNEIREYTDTIENLYLIGRNGMHKYNNQDHSMLTAMTAVDCIISGEQSRDAIWNVNTEEEYHEEKGSN